MRVVQPALLSLALARFCACLIPSPAIAAALVPAITPQGQADTPPLGGGGSVILEPAPPAATRSARRVFVCTGAGSAVFTDLPCGTPAMSPAIDRTSPGPGQSASVSPPASRAGTRPWPLAPIEAVAGGLPMRPDRCVALREEIRAIDARMRDGGSAREAARLWQKWQKASARLGAGRC